MLLMTDGWRLVVRVEVSEAEMWCSVMKTLGAGPGRLLSSLVGLKSRRAETCSRTLEPRSIGSASGRMRLWDGRRWGRRLVSWGSALGIDPDDSLGFLLSDVFLAWSSRRTKVVR